MNVEKLPPEVKLCDRLILCFSDYCNSSLSGAEAWFSFWPGRTSQVLWYFYHAAVAHPYSAIPDLG